MMQDNGRVTMVVPRLGETHEQFVDRSRAEHPGAVMVQGTLEEIEGMSRTMRLGHAEKERRRRRTKAQKASRKRNR